MDTALTPRKEQQKQASGNAISQRRAKSRQTTITTSTGPRTVKGKKRASLNALKYGIFAKALLLKGESAAEYEELRQQFIDYYRPEGIAELIEVECLVQTIWRRRRIIQAERIEIEQACESYVEAKFTEWNAEAQRALFSGCTATGLLAELQYSSNPVWLDQALNALHELRKLASNGFRESGISYLRVLYGWDDAAQSSVELFRDYIWAEKITQDPEKMKREEPGELERVITSEIDEEIRQVMSKRKKTHADLQKEAKRSEGCVLSDPDFAERQIRYEAHLERLYSRALERLERLQRLREGQPVPPPIKVNLTT